MKGLKENKEKIVKQVLYDGRWVDKDTFRAFVYQEGNQKLANSYSEFEQLIASGLWFESKELIKVAVKKRKLKDGAPVSKC